jgi:hypothetical protein
MTGMACPQFHAACARIKTDGLASAGDKTRTSTAAIKRKPHQGALHVMIASLAKRTMPSSFVARELGDDTHPEGQLWRFREPSLFSSHVPIMPVSFSCTMESLQCVLLLTRMLLSPKGQRTHALLTALKNLPSGHLPPCVACVIHYASDAASHSLRLRYSLTFTTPQMRPHIGAEPCRMVHVWPDQFQSSVQRNMHSHENTHTNKRTVGPKRKP